MRGIVDRRTKKVQWLEDQDADKALKSDPNLIDLDAYQEPSQVTTSPVPSLMPRPAVAGPQQKATLPNLFDVGQKDGGLIKTDRPLARAGNVLARLPSDLGVAASAAEMPVALPLAIAYGAGDLASTWNEEPTTGNLVANALGSALMGPAGKAARAAQTLPRLGRMIVNGGIGAGMQAAPQVARRAIDGPEAGDYFSPGANTLAGLLTAGTAVPNPKLAPEARIRAYLQDAYGPEFKPRDLANMQPAKQLGPVMQELRDPNLQKRIDIQKQIEALQSEQQGLAGQVANRKMQRGQALAENRASQANLRKQNLDIAGEKEKLPRNQNLSLRQDLIDQQTAVKKQLEDVNAQRSYTGTGYQPKQQPAAPEGVPKPADYDAVTSNGDAPTSFADRMKAEVRPVFTPDEQAKLDYQEKILADPKKPQYAKDRAQKIMDDIQNLALNRQQANQGFAENLDDVLANREIADKRASANGQPADPTADVAPDQLTPELQMALNRNKLQGLKSENAELLKGRQVIEPNFPEDMSLPQREAYKGLFNGANTQEELLKRLYNSDPSTVEAFARIHGTEKTGQLIGAEFLKRSFDPNKGDFSRGAGVWNGTAAGPKLMAAFGDSPEGAASYDKFHELYNALQEISEKNAKYGSAQKFAHWTMRGGAPMMTAYFAKQLFHSVPEGLAVGAGVAAAQLGVDKLVKVANEHPEVLTFLTNFAKGPANQAALAEAVKADRDAKGARKAIDLLLGNADATGAGPNTFTPDQEKEMRDRGYIP